MGTLVTIIGTAGVLLGCLAVGATLKVASLFAIPTAILLAFVITINERLVLITKILNKNKS